MSSSKTTWLALVALADEDLPPGEAVTQAIAQLWPQAALPRLASETAGMITVGWGEASAAWTLVPRPIPQVQWQGPAETAWYWTEAAEALAQHEAHLLITLVDEGRHAAEKAMRLTQLTSAVATKSDALAILWAPSATVHQPAAFVEQARSMERDDLPLYLWIDFRLEETDEHYWRLFTTGLEAFDRSELEFDDFPGDPRALIEWAYNVAHYQITSESKLKDGDTIGMPDGTQLTSRHEPSMLGGERQVIRLEKT